jgi:hypothetical protein
MKGTPFQWRSAFLFLVEAWSAGHRLRFSMVGSGFLGGQYDFLEAGAAVRGAGRDIFSSFAIFVQF